MENKQLKEKKIAVIGIGGVGGYMAALLANAFPHVTAAARSGRLASIRENGLVLHSDYKGEIAARPGRAVPTEELGAQDVIFICVKNYSLEGVCEEIREFVTDQTVIVPVMNGVDPGERIRRILGRGRIVDACIYTVAFANPDYSVTQQGGFTWLCIGAASGEEKDRQCVPEIAAILAEADIDYRDRNDVRVEIWRKYILNCAYNVTTAYYGCPIGGIREDPARAGEYETLVQEAAAVGRAKGVAITDEHIASVIHRFYFEHEANAGSSLQRDFRDGKRQTELETFSGYLVREANRLGVPAPVSERFYRGLQAKLPRG